MADSKVTPSQPQTDSALKISDPSTTDGTATFTYDPASSFKINDYTTFTQDVVNLTSPTPFSGKLAPSAAPFIVQINGSGFRGSSFTPDPFKIYAVIDNFVAIIPPLSTSSDLSRGHSYGYVVKSDVAIWIYFDRILAQKIWIPVTAPASFTGADQPEKVAIETGDSKYSYFNISIPNALLYIAANTGAPRFDANFLAALPGSPVSLQLTQSPYIVALRGNKNNNVITPIAKTNGDIVEHSIDLFGHGLNGNNVALIKTSSQLLQQNPSKLPDKITVGQTQSSIQSMSAQDLGSLDFFTSDNFLGSLQSSAATDLIEYNYFGSDGKVTNSRANHLPDSLPVETFMIKTLPAGSYNVVVYDSGTGLYGIAADTIMFFGIDSGFQIHSLSPTTATTQNPKFTMNGFNFPTIDALQNGFEFQAYLSDKIGNKISKYSQADLLINATSTSRDVTDLGTITLTSATQMSVDFDALNTVLLPNDDTIVYITVKLIKGTEIQSQATSPPITLQAPPTIDFLTNANLQPAATISASNSIINIDQASGNVIINGITSTTNELFIIGHDFGLKKDLSVTFNGQAQTITDLIRWDNGDDPTLSAIKITTKAGGSIKGNATIEIKSGNISSEPLIIVSSPSLKISAITTNANGNFAAKDLGPVQISLFSEIPKDNSTHKFLNVGNTKISSSLAITLKNSDTQDSLSLSANNATAIDFNPNQIVILKDTPVFADGTINITFKVYGAFSVNFTSPKITALKHKSGDSTSSIFAPGEFMTVVGNGFVDGMRYNINDAGWKTAEKITPVPNTTQQSFDILVPTGSGTATVKISNDSAQSVSSSQSAGAQSGAYKVETIVVNDKYSPLLKINQRLPAGIKMYAKGPQVAMTDTIDANMSIYSQITPFLGSFKTLLIVIRLIVCIIDVLCALINPFKIIIAMIALMDCVIDLLSLFPQLAVPVMILSFLQNFIDFLLTFVIQIKAYVLSIVNTQLTLANAQSSKDFSALAAGEQQSFGVMKQMRDVISFLEPPMQIIQIFKDLLMFTMHIPCSSQNGGTQDNGDCPPPNISQILKGVDDTTVVEGDIEDLKLVPLVVKSDEQPSDSSALAIMFCQAIALQTATLATMPGAPTPGTSSIVANIAPTLPNIAAAIECMSLLADNIEGPLNAGKIFITTPAQGQATVSAFIQCVQGLIDQTRQAIGDVCVLAISALNSELKVSPKGAIGQNISDDFVRTKIPLPSTQPNDTQDAGLILDLGKLKTLADMPKTIITDPINGATNAITNFGLKPDIATPIIIQTANKSGHRQSVNTIYFNAENPDVGGLIVPGDIIEIVSVNTFNGLQFPILSIQQIFTAIRLTAKLDITPEQKLIIGDQPLPGNLSGFDVKIIAHLAGNDAVAIVPADNISLATVHIIARDHHGHEIGKQLADKVAVKIESGDAVFVPVPPSSITDITGTIQEEGDHYIVNLKDACAGTTIVSASVCGIQFQDIGYHANDPQHKITTRVKTVKIIFVPPIPPLSQTGFNPNIAPQEPGTDFVN